MQINTCKYIEASCLFNGCNDIWSVFVNSEANCSWGQNNRSLVTKDVIVDALDNVIDRTEVVNGTYSTVDDVELDSKKVEDFFLRLDSLSEDVYIDLEN